MQASRRRLAEHRPGARSSQYSRRDPALLEHGVEFELHLNLLADTRSDAARACRMVRVERLAGASADRCRISSVVDRRDGWPFFISVLRERSVDDGAREGKVYFFSRLVPLEGFVPPPNPCPSA